MSILKCKICGGNLNVKYGDKITVCEYCGTCQTIQTFAEPRTQDIYNRAQAYLLHNEFDKAESLFNQILVIDNTSAEAYWNILMCRYGVTYVKDPKTKEYVPTCNRTLFTSIFNDSYYLNSIKYADDEQRIIYTQSANKIDAIQKEILKISSKEKPFDIFISYKETNENGSRTKESIYAQELYSKLTELGYKCFFSRITLENKIGIEYEPFIYAALATSKVMIVIGTSPDNLNSVWVKNEWSRFLSFAQKDSSKTLIPLYFDMEKTDLPSEFANVLSYNIKEVGVEQDLFHGIKKLIPLPIMLFEKRKKRIRQIKIACIVFSILLIVTGIASIPWFIKLPEYNNAMKLYYSKRYPEASWAFEKLGNYRKSKELKSKSDLSWRRSLAVPMITLYEGAGSGVTSGYNYIDENGNLNSVDDSLKASNFKVNEHGKIVSLAINNENVMLYEDGFVTNISEKCKNSEDWHDIVQISGNIAQTTVALRNDGKMIYDDISENDEGFYYNISNDWMAPIKSWENITSFTWFLPDVWSYDSNDNKAYIVAITSSGEVHIADSSGKTLFLTYSEAKEYIYNCVNLNNIRSGANVLDTYAYALDDNDTLLKSTTNIPILRDIIYFNNFENYAISKNGNVYALYETVESGKPCLFENIKIITYPEWGMEKYYEGEEN